MTYTIGDAAVYGLVRLVYMLADKEPPPVRDVIRPAAEPAAGE